MRKFAFTTIALLCTLASCKREEPAPPETMPASSAPATQAADDATLPAIPSPTQVRKVAMALLMFADQNKGELSAEWRDLIPQGYLPREFPLADPDTNKGLYIVQHWTAEQAKKLKPSETPIVWTNAPDDSYPLNVGYMDGHVESHRDKSAVNAQLEKAKNILMGKTTAN